MSWLTKLPDRWRALAETTRRAGATRTAEALELCANDLDAALAAVRDTEGARASALHARFRATQAAGHPRERARAEKQAVEGGAR